MLRAGAIVLVVGSILAALFFASCDCDNGGDDDDDGGKPLCEQFCDWLFTCDTADRLGIDSMTECIDFCGEVDNAAGNCVMAADGCKDVDACFPGGDDDDDDDDDNDDNDDSSPYPGVFECELTEDDAGRDTPACWLCDDETHVTGYAARPRCNRFFEIGEQTWSVCSSEYVPWFCANCYAQEMATHCGFDDWRLPTLEELEALISNSRVDTENGFHAFIRRPFDLFDTIVLSSDRVGEDEFSSAYFFSFLSEGVGYQAPDEEEPNACALMVRP
jgi:Protein of unknown function (DUF1566)